MAHRLPLFARILPFMALPGALVVGHQHSVASAAPATTDPTLDSDVKKLREALSNNTSYQKYPYLFRDAYLHLILSGYKPEQRVEKSVKCLEKATKELAKYDSELDAFVQDMPEKFKEKPYMFRVGRDKDGRDILTTDWGRIDAYDFRCNTKEYLMFVIATTMKSIEKNTGHEQHLAIEFVHAPENSLFSYVKATYALSNCVLGVATMFPERTVKKYCFLTPTFNKLARAVAAVLPESERSKLIFGTDEALKEKLEEEADVSTFLPQELGGSKKAYYEDVDVLIG